MHRLLRALPLLALVVLPTTASAVPPGVPYGGYLEDPTGAPYGGLLDIEATLFSAPSGGQALWGPVVIADVAATDGYFDVVLDDSGSPLAEALDGLDDAYLAFRVKPAGASDWIELEGRQRLGAVAFAHEATNAILLGGVSATDYVTAGQLTSSQSAQNQQLTAHTSTLSDHASRLDTLDSSTGRVGDVVTSFLPLAAFQAVHGAGWVLCDGQSAGGSEFETLTGLSAVPDLRGVFLRGKNNGRAGSTGDASGERELGAYVADTFESHQHAMNHDHPAFQSGNNDETHKHPVSVGFAGVGSGGPVGALTPVAQDNATAVNVDSGLNNANHAHTVDVPSFSGGTGAVGSAETAPRHVVVNYFCKIN